ncbi:MAG TPA: hypothetical protein VMM56_09335 [Planctomycetaceae bacterium]|nr:hypothetical protein [Planctomycetaceae bacterium]
MKITKTPVFVIFSTIIKIGNSGALGFRLAIHGLNSLDGVKTSVFVGSSQSFKDVKSPGLQARPTSFG